MSEILGPSGSITGIGLFSGAQVAAIRMYCGYGSYAAYGYILGGAGMATLDEQLLLVTLSEQANIITILTLLPGLDTGISAAVQNLDTDAASVWKHNKTEVAERRALFNYYRRRLCELLNVPPGPAIGGGNMVARS
jgi:hypothetical protein